MIEAIIRDYNYLGAALEEMITPVITAMRPMGPNETIDISGICCPNKASVRFTATVRGQSDGPDMTFVVPAIVVEAAMARLKVEDEE